MKIYENEAGYVQLLKDLLAVETKTPERTGCGTQKTFGSTLSFPDVKEGFPLFSARPVPLHLLVKEMLFFMNGRVQTKELEAQGVNFWHDNTTREFLDKRGLHHLPEGHMGYAYGAVMRHAGGDYDENFQPTGGFDQLKYVVDELKRDIWSRRAIIELWSPQDLSRMALTPCCHNYNFCATTGEDGKPELNLAIKIRSCDTLFGLGASAFGFLLLAMAQLVGIKPKKLSLVMIDSHIYTGGYADQTSYIKETVQRQFSPLPQLKINKKLKTLEDLVAIKFEDLELLNYKPNTLKMANKRPPMAI